MKLSYGVGFLLLMAFDTLAQVSFKFAGIHALPVEANGAWLLRLATGPWIYCALLGYVGAFLTWMQLLRRAPIGPAFAASHLDVVSVMLLSAPLFNERIGFAQVVGAVVLVAGIICLALGERDGSAPAP